MSDKNSSQSAGHELVITHTFNAPRALVWQAWTDPKHVMQWWGPKGFANSSCAVDLRTGGEFNLLMRGPDGRTYPCKGIYREISEPVRIVYDGTPEEDHPCGAGLPPRAQVTITFAEFGHRTTITLHTTFESAARKNAANQAGYCISWDEALGRLAQHIE